MKNQIQIMLDLQDGMNTRVNTDWQEKGFAWYRAIWIESAEMLDHYGWKWWKKQEPDYQQVVLELVDIWHFGLSILILEKVSSRDIAATMEAALGEKTEAEFPQLLENFVAATLASKAFDLPGFCQLMSSIGLDFDQLYAGYVGKNVLNFFRQDHGYQDGSYRKVWAGREDNEHLAELADQLEAGALDYKDQLYGALKARYEETAD